MADIRTAHTVHEIVVSFNSRNNNPVSGATFDTTMFKNGSLLNTGITISEQLVDASRAIFDFSWSATTVGIYQLHIRNLSTNVLYVSEIYNVLPDSYFDTVVYVGI